MTIAFNMKRPLLTKTVFMFLLVTTFCFLIREYSFSRNMKLGPLKFLYKLYAVDSTNLSEKIINKDPCVDIYELDPKKPAAASKSKMSLLQSVNKSFQLGDNITVRITLNDGKGQPKLVGGDHVRVWMVEESKKASSAGYVIDHGNGSYTGHLKALWVGSPVIRSAIPITCEAIGIRHHAFKVPGKLRGLVGRFEFENLMEETDCKPSFDFTGKFCNFKAENFGLPWYCARPKNKKLLCHDWVKVRGIYVSNYTKEELTIMTGHNRLKPDIRVKITTTDIKKNFVSPPSRPCNRFPIAYTWRKVSPVGFFIQNKWLSTYCSYTIEDTAEAYINCLQNRRILIIGDSTARQWLEYLEKILHCVRSTTPFREQRPILSINNSHNITLFWATHGFPYLHPHTANNRGYSKPPHVYLDQIPKGCNDIIIIHLYLHFNLYTPESLRLQARALVQSVNSLIVRSPNVTIAFKGFHAFKDGRFFLDDYWASVYEIIIKTELAAILDKVIYLSCWDITVSSENKGFHNSKKIDKEMVHYALNHMCR